MYDIVIIGAGPAGLTAAIYARRNNKKVLLLESSSYGGQIINTLSVENYPTYSQISGFDFATKLFNQVKELGCEIVFEKAISIKNLDNEKEVITTKNKYKAKTIILATGVKTRSLGLDLEDKLVGKGISYCATCDGAFYKNKDVAVVGGGNTAIEDALYLSDIANRVYLIHRKDFFTAEELLVEKLKCKDNVDILYNSSVKLLNGKDKLESISIENNNETIEISVSGLFIAIGKDPDNQFISDLINTDSSGYIITDENCKTNIDGIFAAGDNRSKNLRQLVTATSDGAIAASEAIKYINKRK